MLTLGWRAIRPDDPLGPVSLLAVSGWFGVALKTSLLAWAVALVGSLLAGRFLPDAGTFAAALGLALLSLQGQTMGDFLLARAGDAGGAISGLEWKLAAEALVWLAAMLASAALSAIVESRGRSDWMARMPYVGSHARAGQPPSVRRYLALVTTVGLMVFVALSVGTRQRAIEHGQACFLVAAAISAGMYAGNHFLGMRSQWWGIVAVGVIAVVGYLSSIIVGTGDRLPPGMPGSPFLRVLPLQFISVGSAAVVAMSWYMAPAEHSTAGDDAERPVP